MRRWGWRLLRWCAYAWLFFIALLLLLRWLPPPLSAFMLQSQVRPVSYQWRDWSQLPLAAGLAAVASEDQRFPLHHGFDWHQINQALTEYRAGEGLRGASTISQQVCKNLFLWPGGGLARKGIEAFCTAHIELLWPKRRILEMYLNIAEFGPGVYGVEAAAQRYFHKPATDLSSAEYALMMTALPSPSRYRLDQPGPYMQERQRWVEQQMRQLGSQHLAALNAKH